MKHLSIFLLLTFIIQTTVQAGNSALKDAIIKGKLPVVQQHLSRANMNKPLDKNGLTPLHLASLYGHKTIVKKLLSLGANVNAKDVFSTQPLHQAAGNGHVAVLRLLKKYGAKLNGQDASGKTALHYAVDRSQAEAIKYLLSIGANPKLKDSSGKTPQDVARKNGRSNIVQLFNTNTTTARKPPPPRPSPTVGGKPVTSAQSVQNKQQDFMRALQRMRDVQKTRQTMPVSELKQKLVGNWVSPHSGEDVIFKADGTAEVTTGFLSNDYTEVAKCYYKWTAPEPNKVHLVRTHTNNRYYPPVDLNVRIRADRLSLPTLKITAASSLKRATMEEVLKAREKRQQREAEEKRLRNRIPFSCLRAHELDRQR